MKSTISQHWRGTALAASVATLAALGLAAPALADEIVTTTERTHVESAPPPPPSYSETTTTKTKTTTTETAEVPVVRERVVVPEERVYVEPPPPPPGVTVGVPGVVGVHVGP